jgi:tetratricopeptide (TPR) repeat protein
VLGTEFALDTLRVGCALDHRELTAALGELVRRNLLEVAGDACRFAHAATRRVVLTRLDDGELPALHGAAGEALEATHPEQVEALATHYHRAGRPDRALPYLRRAADKALQLHAYATAAGHLTTAAELSQQTPMLTSERFDLLAELEQVLGVLGRRDDQAELLEELTALAGADPERVVEAHLRRATYLGHVDRFVDATKAARTAVDLAPADDAMLRGRALTALGQVLMWAGDNEQAVAVLGEAADLLDEEPVDAGRARFALGTALRLLQRFEQAGTELGVALALAETHDDPVGIVQAEGALADLHAETARTDEAVEGYGRAVELAREIGYRHREGVGLVNLGTVRLARAEPIPALAAYDHAETVFEGLGNHRGIAMVQLNRAWLRHRWLGRDEDAERDARAAHRYFDEVGNRGLVAVCLETLAGVARRRGETDEAAELLAAGLAAARASGDQRAEVQILRGLAEAAIDAGEPNEAASLVAHAVGLVRALGLTEFAADLVSLGALASLAAGDVRAAWKTAQDAVQDLPSCGEPHRIHHRIAEVARAHDQERVGQQHQQAAYRLLVDALADLDERMHAAAVEAVPEHRAIVEAGRAVTPRSVTRRMARADAPRGRALAPDETVEVALELGPPPASPQGRQQQLLQVLEQIRGQDAQATVEDLAGTLDVSPSTIRRDLRELRSAGHDHATRGTGTG